MIKKRLALQSSSLREDELELEVPPNSSRDDWAAPILSNGSLGEPLASRLEWISGEEAAAVLGLPGGASRPDFSAVSVCVRVVSLAAGGASGLPWPRIWAPAARAAPPDLRERFVPRRLRTRRGVVRRRDVEGALSKLGRFHRLGEARFHRLSVWR